MGVKGARRSGLFIRYLKCSIRALARARDLYVQSLTSSGAHVSYGNAMGCPTPQIPAVPRSFSAYAASSAPAKTDQAAELRRTRSAAPFRGAAAVNTVTRSRTTRTSFGFGRIDEERPMDHEEDSMGLLRERRAGNGNYPIPRSLFREGSV